MNPIEPASSSGNENPVADYYHNYKEVQADIYRRESRRTRNCIFWIAGLLFASDLLALMMANVFNAQALVQIIVVPLIFTGIGFLALKQPMLAIILATLLFAGLILIVILVLGAVGAISGFIIKAIIIYFLFAGLQSAREAERARKEAGMAS